MFFRVLLVILLMQQVISSYSNFRLVVFLVFGHGQLGTGLALAGLVFTLVCVAVLPFVIDVHFRRW